MGLVSSKEGRAFVQALSVDRIMKTRSKLEQPALDQRIPRGDRVSLPSGVSAGVLYRLLMQLCRLGFDCVLDPGLPVNQWRRV